MTGLDKELVKILDYTRFEQEWQQTKHQDHPGEREHVKTCGVCNKMKTLEKQAIEAIKQAVDKYVIRKDEAQTENGLLPDRVDRRNQLRLEQRESLWGNQEASDVK